MPRPAKLGVRVSEPVEWRGHAFELGVWALLDLYGTDHDGRIWPEPNRFRPDRFERWRPSPFELVPQCGGDVASGHRCPGEGVAVALTATITRLLAAGCDKPEQDLSVDLAAIPALPGSGVVLERVRPSS